MLVCVRNKPRLGCFLARCLQSAVIVVQRYDVAGEVRAYWSRPRLGFSLRSGACPYCNCGGNFSSIYSAGHAITGQHVDVTRTGHCPGLVCPSLLMPEVSPAVPVAAQLSRSFGCS